MKRRSVSVLLIEDSPTYARIIQVMLAAEVEDDFRLDCAGTLSAGLEMLCAKSPQVVLLDLGLPDSSGIDSFARVFAQSPQTPIVVLTGTDDRELALEAVKRGAQDYLVKGKINRDLLVRAVQYAIERKHYQEQLVRQANYDGLTGLPNRNLLKDRLARAVVAQRDAHPLAVVFLDLDHFKLINDSLGHNAGDEVLTQVAMRLRSLVRAGDTVARLGGDEFVLLLSRQAREDKVFRVLRRVLAKVSDPIRVHGREFNITCSAGVSVYPQDGTDAETLLRNADAAMYRAKGNGRNNFQFYTAEMNRAVKERLTLEHSLRRALERKQFVVHYQPKINLTSGAVDGVEALVRWVHPERGLIAPDHFIPLAEESGLIVEIGEWVLREACAQNRVWQDAGYARMTVAVNLSARQFRDYDLVSAVAGVLRETALEPRDLELELTETTVMHDPEKVIDTLHAVRRLGVTLSVDDFGTGYSSLSYLRKLPISTLKIDKSFIRDIVSGTRADDATLVRAIITLGHSLRLNVIAEGVENAAQLRFLKKHRCDQAQGYHFARPMPATEFGQFLKQTSNAARQSRPKISKVAAQAG